ncbi:hypothetical protein [Mesorhizobium argentiipisi]|uniref:Uncharacterized protein n=1 Tax=Mesorhizobium argentiipisi TaxID=3015175 RepID=A0ABU8KDM7_9HYPH
MRFIAVQEPPGNSWAVFDAGNGAPAEYAGRVLIGLTSREARWFATMGNDHTALPQYSGPVAYLRLVRTTQERSGQTGN